MKNFNDCLNRVLKDEGGYSNDPSDSGGATNFGITIADYRKYINKNGTPKDVKNMTVDQAKTIYRTKYWDALGCDTLEAGVDYTCFDYGVNSGLGRPRKALQRFKSLKGTQLIDAINDERTAFLKGLANSRPKDKKFLNGWIARVTRVKNYSHFLSANKADNASGPGSAITTAGVFGGYVTMFTDYLHTHPYVIAASIAGTAALIGLTVHYFRNK